MRLGVRFDRILARITWIGHSTVLIELDGVRLLTDPVFRPRVLHLRRLGASPPAVDLRFRLARRWHVSDLWLQLYVRHPAVRDPDGHGRA